MYFTKYRPQILLFLITLFSTLLMWGIFYAKLPSKIGFPASNLETVFSNYDGPYYLAISKCGYDKGCIGPNFALPQPLEYYPAHLPGYPTVIRLFNNFTTGPKAMLFTTLLGSLLLTLVSYSLFKSFWLSFFLIFFPPRLFILRLVGAPETWFLSLTLLSIFYFKQKKYLLSSIFASLCILFKTPGIILGIVYLILFFKNIENWKLKIVNFAWFLLMPLTLFLIFFYYKGQTGDFMAYFHSGDNFHLNPLPYLVFVSNKSWIGTIWLEEILYIYFFAFYGCQKLFKKYKFDIIAIYPIVFTFFTLLVAHRDISRYIAPVYPFLFFAFRKKLESKSIRLVLFLLLPAVVLYAINFIIGNTAPIGNWTPYL